VQFIIKHDPGAQFCFASLQSEAAAKRARVAGAEIADLPDSVALIEQGHVYTRSTAALRIARRLNGLLPLAYAFILVPRPIRDRLYDLVARNRHRFFKRTTCAIPTPELRKRFLTD
jgi:predicted DCC family thiol-disulfide oxidoreductase YuxK